MHQRKQQRVPKDRDTESIALGDGFKLIDCKITNAVKWLPPQNKPTGSEINTCNRFLKGEGIKELSKGKKTGYTKPL